MTPRAGWRKTWTVTCDDCGAERNVTTTTSGPDEDTARQQMIANMQAAGWSVDDGEHCPTCVAKVDGHHPDDAEDHPTADPPGATLPSEGDPPAADTTELAGDPPAKHAEPPQV